MNRKYPIIHVGDKFNRWTAIEDEVIGDKYVLCRCSCGVTKRVKKDSLFSQKSKSCGCYNREISSQMAKLKQSLNKIEVVDDIAKVY